MHFSGEPYPMPRRIIRHLFSQVVSHLNVTGFADLPIVMWSDPIDPARFPDELLHEDFCSLYFVRQGRGMHVIDGHRYPIVRGDVYVMGVGSTHHFEDVSDLILDTIHFTMDIFDGKTLDALAETQGFHALFVTEPMSRRLSAQAQGRWLHLSPHEYETVMGAYRELYREWRAGTADGRLLTGPLFLRLLVMLARLYAASERKTPQSELRSQTTVSAAVRRMEEGFREPLRVEDIARSVFLSADRFTEVFQKEMGRTPRDYIRHLRIEEAKRLLRSTDASIAVVGIDSGFGEPGYFSRSFRQATGMTPREYRRAERILKAPQTRAEIVSRK